MLATAIVLLLVSADVSPREAIDRMLQADQWGLNAGEVSARVTMRGKNGKQGELAFTARSHRYEPTLSKSLIRFSAPADVAGTGFLQVQKKAADDDRFLYLPELHRSRRIGGDLRATAFMGTDFYYADIDQRDFRDGAVSGKPDEELGGHPCYHITVEPKDSPYSRVEAWVRKDNFLMQKAMMYDKAGVLWKTLSTLDGKKIGQRWFITKSAMQDHKANHMTELSIERIVPMDVPDSEFTVRNLEKL